MNPGDRSDLLRPLGGSRFLLVALLGGCAAVGPDYVPPAPAAPTTWVSPLEKGLQPTTLDRATLTQWWNTLNDPVLSQLVERVAASNLDVQAARARVREARARRGFSAADRFPTVGLNAKASSTRIDPDPGPADTTDLYSIGFDADWELDIFGSKRRALEAADAQLQASEEDLRDVTVSLLAEVALNYIDLRAFQKRIVLGEKNLRIQQDSYELVRWRADAGLTTQLDVQQARFSLEQTRSQLPQLYSALQQSRHALAVLLGQPPGALNNELSAPAPIPVTPLEVAIGVPADMLRQRPDVRRAERQLAAQTAQVGVATAQRYPNLSLAGTIGIGAASLGDLSSAATQTSALVGTLSATLFDAGRLRQNVEIQNAVQEQAYIQYETTVLGALQEAENAIVAYVQEQDRRAALVSAADAANQAAALANHQYESGLVDFDVVLVAQRAALSLEDQLATSEGEISADLVRLYKALGGGWTAVNMHSADQDEN